MRTLIAIQREMSRLSRATYDKRLTENQRLMAASWWNALFWVTGQRKKLSKDLKPCRKG